ncbi:MAG: hypothetical protein IKO40_03575, partial [Kiritimatiellae bacterium]|nr:hypothetical protein [Kiritimatiellia bacterium]
MQSFTLSSCPLNRMITHDFSISATSASLRLCVIALTGMIALMGRQLKLYQKSDFHKSDILPNKESMRNAWNMRE